MTGLAGPEWWEQDSAEHRRPADVLETYPAALLKLRSSLSFFSSSSLRLLSLNFDFRASFQWQAAVTGPGINIDPSSLVMDE